MIVHLIPILSDNYSFILEGEKGATIVDPGEASPILTFLKAKKIVPKMIWLTHHHHDHIGGVQEICRKFPHLEVWGPRDARIPSVCHYAEEGGDAPIFDQDEVQILHLPGHTSTHIGYYLPKLDLLFSGDVLFGCGCGRIFEGTFEEMWQSLQKIKQLPAKTKIYFAHEYTKTNLNFCLSLSSRSKWVDQKRSLIAGVSSSPALLSQEIEINPFLEPSLLKDILPNLSDFERFCHLRTLRNSF